VKKKGRRIWKTEVEKKRRKRRRRKKKKVVMYLS
jgi:hypothetical protein